MPVPAETDGVCSDESDARLYDLGQRPRLCAHHMRTFAPFIAQLAGQMESPEDARARRRERRETANCSYERTAQLKPAAGPTLKVSA